MRGGSRDLLLWPGSGSCSRKPTTMPLRNGQLDRSNARLWPKPPHPGHDGRFSGLKPGYASSRLTHGLIPTPSAGRLQIRRAAMVSNSANLKPFAAVDATVGWAKRRQRRRVPTIGGAGCGRWARCAEKLVRQGRTLARLCPPYGSGDADYDRGRRPPSERSRPQSCPPTRTDAPARTRRRRRGRRPAPSAAPT